MKVFGYLFKTIICVFAIVGVLLLYKLSVTSIRDPLHIFRSSQAGMENIESALLAYRLDFKSFPTESEGLSVLVNVPLGHGDNAQAYLDRVPIDFWGFPYQYNLEAGKPKIWSKGVMQNFELRLSLVVEQ